jgi:competence protein ComEA
MRLTFLLLTLVLGTIAFPFTYAETSVDKIDINSADVEILARELYGIGPKKAAAIVEFREKNGPFQSIEDLQKVYGIGKKTFEKNRDKIIAIQPEDSSTEVPEKPAEASPTESKVVPAEVPATTDSITPIDD